MVPRNTTDVKRVDCWLHAPQHKTEIRWWIFFGNKSRLNPEHVPNFTNRWRRFISYYYSKRGSSTSELVQRWRALLMARNGLMPVRRDCSAESSNKNAYWQSGSIMASECTKTYLFGRMFNCVLKLFWTQVTAALTETSTLAIEPNARATQWLQTLYWPISNLLLSFLTYSTLRKSRAWRGYRARTTPSSNSDSDLRLQNMQRF